MAGIVDWRLAERAPLGVDIRDHVVTEAADVIALQPGYGVIATGGLPQVPEMAAGAALTTTIWDILSGAVKPGGDVLAYDDNAAHPVLSAVEVLRAAGARVELRHRSICSGLRSNGQETNCLPICDRISPRRSP